MDDLPAPKLYLPFEPGPHRLAMGLSAIPREAMFEIDTLYHEELALKRTLLAERRDMVFAALPASDAVRPFVARYVADGLIGAHPAWFSVNGDRFANALSGDAVRLDTLPDDPLAWAGVQVQEDLCVMQRIKGRYCLTEASLSFPSRWRLAEKLGKPMAVIHQPVPDYAERLEHPVNRFFDHLKPDRVVCRFNWTIHDDAALHQPDSSRSNACVTGNSLYLRVERQTLSVVPETEVILFTIKVHVTPLAEVFVVPGAALRLAAAVRQLPDSTLAYRGMNGFRDRLLDYLQEKTAVPKGTAVSAE